MTTASRVDLLNVDDTEAARYAKQRTLHHAGFEVVEAGTGGEALAKVEELRPALVLLDVHLPDISGIEVCRIIKQRWPHDHGAADLGHLRRARPTACAASRAAPTPT